MNVPSKMSHLFSETYATARGAIQDSPVSAVDPQPAKWKATYRLLQLKSGFENAGWYSPYMAALDQLKKEVDRAISEQDRPAIGLLEQELFVLAHKLRVARRYLTQQTYPVGAGHARLASSK